MTAGDVNGDGYPDVLVYDQTYNTVAVYINQGDGTLNIPLATPLLNDFGTVNTFAAGDVNNDGLIEAISRQLAIKDHVPRRDGIPASG